MDYFVTFINSRLEDFDKNLSIFTDKDPADSTVIDEKTTLIARTHMEIIPAIQLNAELYRQLVEWAEGFVDESDAKTFALEKGKIPRGDLLGTLLGIGLSDEEKRFLASKLYTAYSLEYKDTGKLPSYLTPHYWKKDSGDIRN